MFRNSWFNSDYSLVMAWTGSTFFTGASFIIHQFSQNLSPLTIAGWILTSSFTIIASISRWKLNRAEETEKIAEARRQNALAEQIEMENKEKHRKLLVDECDKSACVYRDFYENLNPLLINHFGINTANNQTL